MVYSRVMHVAMMLLVWGGSRAATLADGRTYYVRQGGSDMNDGLGPDTAVRSIQRAVSRCAVAGNTIIVGPGVYYEQVFIGSGSGSAAGNGTADNPNLIVADATGSETGDTAAPVVIEGDGVRECGISLSDRDNWAIVGLSFRGQSQRAISAQRCDGIEIESCTIDLQRQAGIEANDCDALHIAGNTFNRGSHSGSCIVVQGTSRDNDHHDGHNDNHSRTIVIESNRFSLIGDLYLESDFARGGHGRHDHHDGETYGIRVEATGDRARVQIVNNVGSDCWAGISVQLDGDDASGVIANNSLAGCRAGIEADTSHGSLLVADNIIAQSTFAIVAQRHNRGLEISGLLTFEIGGSVVLGEDGPKAIVGHLRNVDPKWVAPSAGNFALDARSPAVDAGLGAGGLGRDLRGLERPWDGDGDGEAVADLGAYEYRPEDQQRSLRLVQWREIEPQ